MQATNRNQDDAGIAQRYLAGQLSPPEQEAYEQYFISNPEAVQELEATARMKVGLASLRDSGQLDALLHAAPTTSRRVALMAIAASVAVIAITVGLWRNVRAPEGSTLVASAAQLVDVSGKSLKVGASYALMRTRATDYDAEVVLPSEPLAIELRVRPEVEARVYRAALSRIGTDGSLVHVAIVNGLKAEGDGFLRIYLDSSKLEAGSYLLAVSATPDQSERDSDEFVPTQSPPAGGSDRQR